MPKPMKSTKSNSQRGAKSEKDRMAGNADKRSDLFENLVQIRRVSKVVKGGKRFSLAACMVVGDGNGRVGLGTGKAREVPDAIRKATDQARKSMVGFSMDGSTIPHEILGAFKASRVMMKPAAKGTGLIAGGAVRSVLEVSGVRDILTKSLKSSNPINVAKATIDGLTRLKDAFKVEALRGVKLNEVR